MKKDLVSKLKKIGLNEYEAKTYLALLSQGQQTAKEISNNSKVPYSRIYDVLSNLREKNWVQEIDKNPKRFQAKHERFTLKKSKEKMNELIDELEKEIKSYKKSSYQKIEPEILILEGWATIKELMSDEINEAENNITTMLGFNAEYFSEFLEKLKRKKIALNLITRIDIDLPEEKLGYIEKSKLPFTPKIWVTWFDWKKIIAIFPSMSDDGIIEEDVRGILLSDKNFGRWANQMVENIDFK